MEIGKAQENTQMSFKNQVALVTGGTSGIGRTTAIDLAKRGAHVVITGRRAAEGEAVAAEICKHGVKGVFVQGDVSKEADIEKAVAEALKLTGQLDLAFNNAGVEGEPFIPVVEQTEAHYRKVFDINVLGVLLSLKHEIRAMSKNNGGKGAGSIVNTSSVAGSVGMGTFAIYVASKHAVLGLTKSAALEVAKNGIRINSVSPGAIETEMYDRFASNDDTRKYMASLHPIGRVGKSEEIASGVLWLLSSEASFVTGQDLVIDGGFTAQ